MATTPIVFTADYDEESYHLMELPVDVCDSLTLGDEVYIVGDPSQRAVLCTPKQSYYLIKEDQSNLRMLVDSNDWEKQSNEMNISIRGCSINHYELIEKPLDVNKLKELLMESPWTNDSTSNITEEKPTKKKKNNLYSLTQLMDLLQHSAKEVKEILNQLKAVEIDGYWRLIQPSYARHVMNEVFDLMVQNDWEFSKAYNIDEFKSQISVHSIVLVHCILDYSSVDANGLYTFNPTQIAVFHAISLFEEKKEWNVQEFMEQWSFRLPEGVSTDITLLQGIAILRQDGTTLTYFPQQLLSIDHKKRFQEMFSFQAKWTLSQLEPYLKQLISGKMTQASLLLKYTRASRVLNSTERLYSKR